MKLNLIFAIVFVTVSAPQVSHAQVKEPTSDFHIVGAQEMAATLASGRATERITGRISFSLTSKAGNRAKNQLSVRDFNVVFFGVSQNLIAPRVRPKEPLGVLGFAATPGKAQTLHYDARRSQISGQIEMSGDASVMSALMVPIRDEKGDLFSVPRLVTIATIRIDLETPLNDRLNGIMTSRARLDIRFFTRGARYRNFDVASFTIRLNRNALVNLDLATDRGFKVVRQLCVQPVRVSFGEFEPFGPDPHLTLDISGAGLKFGEPGARTEWEKADVIFDIRPWKIVGDNKLFILISSEKDRLLARVDDDDCIEVFFVKAFSPNALWGGGAMFGAGAGAKIISSDENALFEIDFTHLAHELGHVMGLDHPNVSTPGFVTATTGTLMCASGFRRDNPRVNSQGNRDAVSNPLFISSLQPIGLQPDCVNNADCPRCP